MSPQIEASLILTYLRTNLRRDVTAAICNRKQSTPTGEIRYRETLLVVWGDIDQVSLRKRYRSSTNRTTNEKEARNKADITPAHRF